jgi:putative ABC transport system permease protein
MEMIGIIAGGIILLMTLIRIFQAGRYPHLRRMAWRNTKTHRSTTILTIIGAMVGTSLITATFMLYSSIDDSVKTFVKTQFGPIENDITYKEGFISEKIWADLKPDLVQSAQVLPTVRMYGNLSKSTNSKQISNFFPHVYIHAFDHNEAQKFDPEATKVIPSQIGNDEMVISTRLAQKLEVKQGDQVQLLLPSKNKPTVFTIKKVVSEQGLTGYRGVDNGKATAIISLATARHLLGIEEEFTNILYSSSSIPASLNLEKWSPNFSKTIAHSKTESIKKFVFLFFITSMIAIAIGIIFVINIFKMIAVERKQELGMLRAIGMNVREIRLALRMEGFLYSITSSLAGILLGIGLSYVVLLKIKDLLALSIQYENDLDISYHFSINPSLVIAGFAIGMILIDLCMLWISRNTAKQTIVQLLQTVNESHSPSLFNRKKHSGKTIVYVSWFIFTIGLIVFTQTTQFADGVNEEAYEDYIRGGIAIIILLSSVGLLHFGLPVFFIWLQRRFRSFPKVYGTLSIAFRYPSANKKRTSLLLFMFTLVLFLTGFSSVVSAFLGSIANSWDEQKVLGGYHLAIKADHQVSTDDLKKMINRSSYINKNEIKNATAIYQTNQPTAIINGIDADFAKNIQLPLLKRDTNYQSDRAAWLEVAKNPNVAIISEETLRNQSKTYKIGDFFPLQQGKNSTNKKIIGVAKYNAESYGFNTSYGLWIKQSEVTSLTKHVQTTFLLQVHHPTKLGMTAKGIEKEFYLQGFYGMQNPQQMIIVGRSFIQIIFTLLESFSFLATIIGLAGLMVIMFRQIHERRQQLGMLRALGIGKRLLYWGIFSEGFVVATMGISLGIGLGSFVGDLLLQDFTSNLNASYTFPYAKLGIYFVIALLISLICSLIPARQTLKLSPVEATRYTS